MTSLRHTRAAEPAPTTTSTPGATGSEDACLDAARSALLDVGWRRTTLTEVARRAGVSRMTIYRRWPDTGALLGDLMTREWSGTVAAAVPTDPTDGTAPGTAPEVLADTVVATVRALRANDLFARILELDPELLLPYLFERPGRLQEHLLELLVPHLETGRAAGEVRDTDPRLLARSLLLAVHGFALSLPTLADPATGVDEDALYAELHRLVHSHVAPAGTAAPGGGV